MKAVVAAFNQEKALSRGLLRAYEPSDGTFSSTTEYTRLEADETGLIYIYLSRYLSIYVSPAAQ